MEEKLLPLARFFCKHDWLEIEPEAQNAGVEGIWRLIFRKHVCTKCGSNLKQDTNPRIVGPGETVPR